MPDAECKIAILTADLHTFKETFVQHCAREEINSRLQMEMLQEIRDKQAKMAGFWAGCVFVVGAVAAGVTMLFSK